MRGLTRSSVAVAVAFAIGVCGAAPAAADAPLPPGVHATGERAATTAHPAVVRVNSEFSGYFRDQQGRDAFGGRAYTFTFTCSGFGVHPDGYLATAGHCIDANDITIQNTFFRGAAEELAAVRPDIPYERWLEMVRSTLIVEGPTPGSPIGSEIRVSGLAGAPPDGVLARVVDDRPIGQGDIGLLKIDITDVPVLELATDTGLAVGVPLFAMGHPESAGAVVGLEVHPSIANGSVTAPGTDGGRPVYETDAALEAGLSGGPAVDGSGRVLGINSARKSGNLVIPISAFTDLLGRNSLSAELGPRDRIYRDALDAYYTGEYTDAIDAIDRLQQAGPPHPRVGELRTDAEVARDRYGDASENRRAEILMWVGITTAAVVVVVIGGLLVARRRRMTAPVVIVSGPRSPLSPYPGQAPGAAGPGVPLAQPPVPASSTPNHMYSPAAGSSGRVAAPGRPGSAPIAVGPFDGPTRPFRMRPHTSLTWPVDAERTGNSEIPTTTVQVPTPPGISAEPRSAGPSGGEEADRAPAGAGPADSDPAHGEKPDDPADPAPAGEQATSQEDKTADA